MPKRRGLVLLEILFGLPYIAGMALQVAAMSGSDVAGVVSVLLPLPILLLLMVRQNNQAGKLGSLEGKQAADSSTLNQMLVSSLAAAQERGALLERTRRTEEDVRDMRHEVDTTRESDGKKRHDLREEFLKAFSGQEIRIREVEQRTTVRQSDRSGDSR